VRHLRRALRAGHRAEQHDAAAPAPGQPATDDVRQVCGEPAVEVQHRVEPARRHVQERPDRRRGRVAHEQSNIKTVDGTGDLLRCLGGARVDRGGPHLDPVRRPYLARQVVEHGLPARDEDEVDTARRQRVRERGADAVRPADDQRPGSVPVVHHPVQPARRASE